MAQRETLFTPKDRSVIIKAILHEGGTWEGTRKRFKVHFLYDKSAPKGLQIVWGVAIHRRWIQGNAETVFDAMSAIESKVSNRSLDAREAKMLAIKFEEENA